MADLIEEMEEEESDIEIHNVNLEEEASSTKGRKRENSDRSNGLDSEKIRKLMRKINSTLQQNPDRKKKGRKSTILVFYHHPQNKKKNENRPMADEETPDNSSNTSPDNSPSKPLGPPGVQDAEQSA